MISLRTILPALLFVPLLAVAAGEDSLRSGVFNPPRNAPEISLPSTDGSELKLSRFRGKVVALSFGFTTCPEVCPTTLAELAAARKQLGDAGKNFQVVYVTVDPERDTAERLKQYLTGFDPSFIGVTGTPQQIAALQREYGITSTKKALPGGGYTVHHSAFVYLIDREGRLRALSPYGRKIDDFVHDVRILLKQ
jgi:protein SCO1/2